MWSIFPAIVYGKKWKLANLQSVAFFINSSSCHQSDLSVSSKTVRCQHLYCICICNCYSICNLICICIAIVNHVWSVGQWCICICITICTSICICISQLPTVNALQSGNDGAMIKIQFTNQSLHGRSQMVTSTTHCAFNECICTCTFYLHLYFIKTNLQTYVFVFVFHEVQFTNRCICICICILYLHLCFIKSNLQINHFTDDRRWSPVTELCTRGSSTL